MIFGVYLAVPIVNKFIQHASIREIEYFIIVFLLASVFYQFVLFYKFDNYFNLNFFAAPIGFLVLGYYLSVKDFKIDSRKLMILMMAVFLFATSMKMLSTGAIMPKSFALNYEATQSVVLDSWVDVSIFVILQAGSFCFV